MSSTLRQRAPSHGRKVSRIHFDLARCCSGDLDVAPAIHRAARNALEHHDLAGPVVVSAGNTKYSPTVGIKLKQTAECSGRGVMPLHISERERALRLVERRARGIALEQAARPRPCPPLQSEDRRRVRKLSSSATPASAIVSSPPRRWNSAIQAGNFHALVDALRGPVEHAVPVDRLSARAIGRRHR